MELSPEAYSYMSLSNEIGLMICPGKMLYVCIPGPCPGNGLSLQEGHVLRYATSEASCSALCTRAQRLALTASKFMIGSVQTVQRQDCNVHVI